MAYFRKTLATVCVLAVSASPALALDEIYSPNVGYHELAVEYNGNRTFDSHADKNNIQGQELTVEAGITQHWLLGTNAVFSKDAGANTKLEAAGIENRFQFFEQGEYWLDAGLLAAYNFSTQGHVSDSAEVKLLLQKDIGWFTSTANIGFEQNVGQYAGGGGPDYVFLWNTRYRYNTHFEPGIEIQSDLGQRTTLGNFNKQTHYVGPALYGEIIPHLGYQAAWLLGASQAATQSAARFMLEYEMHF